MMKRIVVLTVLFCCLGLGSSLFAQDVTEIIDKAKQASMQLKTVKIITKTVTGSIDVSYGDSSIDYEKERFFAVEKKNGQVLRTVYVVDGIAYMYNALVDTWFKFAKEINPVGDAFDRKKVLSQFPDNYEEAGFSVEVLEEEKVEGYLCYVIESKVVDSERAAKFAFRFLDQFVSPQIAVLLRENKEMLEDYLGTYMSSSESKLWIDKNSFLIIKVFNKHRQPTGPEESVPIERETVYYDFNQTLDIKVPEEAAQAPMVSADDLGLNLKKEGK